MTDRPIKPAPDRASAAQRAAETPENPWVEALKTIGLSVVLALGIRTYVAEARYIPSESMLPTLQINDRLIVEKVRYKFGREPERGDVIVFAPTDALRESNFRDAMIKRVIGLPGDRVSLREGRVWVNGEPLLEPYVADEGDLDLDLAAGIPAPNLTFANGQQQTATNVCGPKEVPYLRGEVTVPQDSYLVMGDNRNRSYDSRCWGTVPRDRIIGQAVWRFWPLARLGALDDNRAAAAAEPGDR